MNMNKPIPPRPQCVTEGAGTREQWNEYHIKAALYYDGIIMSLAQIKSITGQK